MHGMSHESRISEEVLQVLKKECDNDEIIESFLIDLIFEESEHSGGWWWKKTYKKYINDYQSRWREDF
jgi:hypothetical protein